jgi:F-type H+-transporting ATPase subunit delta
MTARTIAKRYAHALHDVLKKGGDVDRAEADLNGFRDLMASHADLRRALESPAVPVERKQAIVDALWSAAHGTSEPVHRTLHILAERDRFWMIGEVAAAYTERVLQAKHVVAAEIVTAVPLGETKRAAVAAALGKAAGAHLTIKERVDPQIIGGVVARVGSLVFDGSVTRQLERLKQQLLAEKR